MKEYALEELMDICASNQSPEIRRIACKLAYTTGERDEKVRAFERRFGPAATVNAEAEKASV